LIDGRLRFFSFAPKPNNLFHEHSWQSDVRIIGSDFIGFTARKSGDAERLAQTETLIDLGIDPNLGALPKPQAHIEGGIPRFASRF